MRFQTQEFSAKRSWSLPVFRFLLAALLLCSTVAVAADHRRKIAVDLSSFPVHRDGTVDVIIQFKQRPSSRHFMDMAAHGGKLKRSLQHISGASYRIPARMLVWLETHPDVAYVSPDRPNRPSFDDVMPAVMGDLARQQYGFDGSGVGVAVIDSGVYDHPDLQSADGTASRIVYGESFVPNDPSPDDAYGHGTHVAGIIAGNGRSSQSGYGQQYIGVAPNANIINLRVLDATGAGADSQVIAALQRAVELKDTYNIRVINISLGRNIYESYSQDPLCQAVEAAWQAGMVVVVAAGNAGRDNNAGTGGYGTIQAPGNDPSVITVGATKTNGTPTRLDDAITSFSSKGPSIIDHVVKPDLVAPGNRIVSLESPGSYLATMHSAMEVVPAPTCGPDGTCTIPQAQYLRLSGTSMATPVVAGAAAMMIQQNPDITPDTVKARMMKTAWKGYPTSSWTLTTFGFSYLSKYDVFTVGAGYLDVDAALHNVDVASGSAASPVAVYDTYTRHARLVNSPPPLGGTSIIWESASIWGTSITWGAEAVSADSIIWDDQAAWSDPSLGATSIIWSDSIIWDDQALDALSIGEDGEN